MEIAEKINLISGNEKNCLSINLNLIDRYNEIRKK